MKILVAIKSTNSKSLSDKVMSWAPRAGYITRIFITNKEQISKYMAIIDDINYQHYLDATYDMLITDQEPRPYAKSNGYDLLLVLPENLSSWNKTEDVDKMVIEYAMDVGKIRVLFGKRPTKKIHRFKNGAIMYRV